ncbi:MAG: S41 family peptidase [Raineya sp.]|jgi:C-terminal processing protease CtpA/Prc|nr:S41 family peptidase [Raineya sp.]
MKFSRIILIITALISFWSCKKTENYQVGADLRDSVYIYSKELYLWTDRMPDIFDFKPKNFSTAEDIISIVKTYSPVINGKNVDKYSFVQRKSDWDNISAGNRVDYGCGYRFISDNDFRISFVYANSAAGKQGVQRGWRLLKVNDIVPDQSTLSQLSTALFNSTSVTILFRKNDGSEVTLTLTPQNYTANFILDKRVINSNGKKIAYLVFNSFLGGNNGKDTQAELTQAFDFFASQGATELIVDLRYNGGGYVFLAEYLCNLMAPASAKGKIMFTERWNSRYSQFDVTSYFDNSPSKLNLSKVVFITTNSTASASELTINSLRPYLDVKIIGTATAGKPVGFPVLPIIMDRSNPNANYVVAPVAFQSFNANNFGDYFEGLTPDKIQKDDVSRNFGDVDEACLKDALNYLTLGVLQRESQNLKDLSVVKEANEVFNKDYYGTIKLVNPKIFVKK